MNYPHFETGELTGNFIQLHQLDRYMTDHAGYIAGGVFKNIFNNEKFKDIDIFFESNKDFQDAENHFSNNADYVKVYENSKAIAFRNLETNIILELIHHVFMSPLEMIDSFDFTITQFVYYKEEAEDEDSVSWNIAYHKKFFEHLHLKRLVITKEVDEIILPASSFNRMFRYGKYGYFPCRETKVKIIEALRKMPTFSEDDLSKELYNGLD